MASWLESVLADLAPAVEADVKELASKVEHALLPNLSADLTPLVESAVDAALAGVPFSAEFDPFVNDVIAKVVAELVSVIEAHFA